MSTGRTETPCLKLAGSPGASGSRVGLLPPARLDRRVKPAYLPPYLIYGKIIYGKRCKEKGWVKAEWGRSENIWRARIYKLTPAGRNQLKQEVADFGRVLEAILRVAQPA